MPPLSAQYSDQFFDTSHSLASLTFIAAQLSTQLNTIALASSHATPPPSLNPTPFTTTPPSLHAPSSTLTPTFKLTHSLPLQPSQRPVLRPVHILPTTHSVQSTHPAHLTSTTLHCSSCNVASLPTHSYHSSIHHHPASLYYPPRQRPRTCHFSNFASLLSITVPSTLPYHCPHRCPLGRTY